MDRRSGERSRSFTDPRALKPLYLPENALVLNRMLLGSLRLVPLPRPRRSARWRDGTRPAYLKLIYGGEPGNVNLSAPVWIRVYQNARIEYALRIERVFCRAQRR